MSNLDSFEKGKKAQEQGWGNVFESKEYKSDFLESVNEIFPEFFKKMVTEHLWGEVSTLSKLPRYDNVIVYLTLNGMVNVAPETVLETKMGLASTIRIAVKHGMSREAIEEIFINLAHYAGWPVTMNCFLVLNEVFKWEKLEKGKRYSTNLTESEQLEKGKDMLQRLNGKETKSGFLNDEFPDFWKITVGHLFGNIWNRKALTLRQLIIINLTANMAFRCNYGLEKSLQWAINNGISKEDILMIVMIIAHFRGWATGINALKVVKNVLL